MRVTIRYFAVLREAAGRSAEERVLSPGTSVGDLLDRLAEDYPIVGRLRAYSRVMVNQEYVPLDHPLADGDEFVIIPPVSGGAGPFRVVTEPIDPDDVAAAVAAPDAGAIVTFQGTVRDNARGRRVLYLEYDAYPAAAEKTLAYRSRRHHPPDRPRRDRRAQRRHRGRRPPPRRSLRRLPLRHRPHQGDRPHLEERSLRRRRNLDRQRGGLPGTIRPLHAP